MKYVFLIFCWHVGDNSGNQCNPPVLQPSKEICEFMGKNMIVTAAHAGHDGDEDGNRMESYRCPTYTVGPVPPAVAPKVKR